MGTGGSSTRLGTAIAAALLGIAGLSPAGAQTSFGGASDVQRFVLRTDHQDTSAPLRRMASRAQEEPATSRPQPARNRDLPASAASATAAADPVVDRGAPAAAAVPIAASFEGVENLDNNAEGFGLPIPPDTVGDVGPNHYVQMTNVVTEIFNKSGSSVMGPFPNNQFWSGFGGPCETTNDGDPIVLHDHLADRWLVSQFALPGFPAGPFFMCVAISQTADPTGSYHRYSFSFLDLPDYPKFGVWPNGYFMSANLFEAVSLDYLQPQILAFDRVAMLGGGPANAHGFLLPPSSFTVLPSDLDGATLPPAGAPNHFIELRDPLFFPPPAGLQIWDFTPDFVHPHTNAMLDGPMVVPTAAYDGNMCNFNLACIPQPGTSQKLDALSDRLMHRAAYRNFGTHESLLVSHTVDVGTNDAGVRWHEVRGLSSPPFLYQEGTIAPDANHRWMPSAAMDGQGNIAVGYSVSSNTVFPSIRFSARRASDPLGTMGLGETTIVAGGGSQTGGNRWGDYGAMTPDPSNDAVLWFTHEYYQTTDVTPGNFPFGKNWQTRIASILMPQLMCFGVPATWVGTPGADTFVGTGAADVVLALGGADDIDTKGGDDRVCAGPEDDGVTTGPGADRAKGQGGDDSAAGGGGPDTLLGNAGNDLLKGQLGGDTLKGGTGNDTLNGGGGIDSCADGPGTDTEISCEQ